MQYVGVCKILSLDRNLKSESLSIMLQCLALYSLLFYPGGTVFESRSGHRQLCLCFLSPSGYFDADIKFGSHCYIPRIYFLVSASSVRLYNV